MAAASKNKIEIILSAIDQGISATIRKVRRDLSELGRTVASVTKIFAPLTTAISGVAGAAKLVDVTREFDRLSAGLVTATGSVDGAKTAFASIQDFAASTPYDLAQVTDGFVKLVNFGLDPSVRAMTSYGNTASALGKSLNQMIEAVADAATGEFERLKEFGIKAKSEGDQVSFTFRGVTTTVGKNAAEIEHYLIALGETNFGNAMSERMKTLDGALSNLGDEWNKLFLNISQQGIGDAIANGVRAAITVLQELNDMIASGELEASLTAYANQWKGWVSDVNDSVDLVRQAFFSAMDDTKQAGSEAVAWLTSSFRSFPENVRAFIGLLAVEFASTFDKLIVQARAYKDSVKAIFSDDTLDAVEERKKQQLEAINTARDESIDAILKERDTALKAAADETAAIKKTREEYDKKQKAKAEAAKGKDALAQFRVSGEDGKKAQGPEKAEKSLTEAAKKKKELAEEDERAAIRAADAKRRANRDSVYYKPERQEENEQRQQTVTTTIVRPATIEEQNDYQRAKSQATEEEKERADRARTAGESFDDALKKARAAGEREARNKERRSKVSSGSSSAALIKKEIEEVEAARKEDAKELLSGIQTLDVLDRHHFEINMRAAARYSAKAAERKQAIMETLRAENEKNRQAELDAAARGEVFIGKRAVAEYDPAIAALEKKAHEEEMMARRRKSGTASELEQNARNIEIERKAFKDAAEAKKKSLEAGQKAAEIEYQARLRMANLDKEMTDKARQRNEELAESAKKAAAERIKAEEDAIGQAKSIFEKYAERVKTLQNEIAGREKSLADELAELDPHATEEQRWRRRAKAAKDYEQAARAAMAAGRLDEAREYADLARTTFAELKDGSGHISDRLANRTAFSGVSSAGNLGVTISRMMTDAAARAAKSGLMGIDGLNNRVSAQLRKAMGALAEAAPTGPGKQAPVQVHEIRLGKARLQGSADDVTDFIRQLELAGMRA